MNSHQLKQLCIEKVSTKRDLSSVSIKKAFSMVKAIYNFASKESGVDLTNTASGVNIQTMQYMAKIRL